MVQKGPDRGLGSLRFSRGGVAIIHRVRLGGCFVFVFDNHKYSSLTPHARLSMRTNLGKKNVTVGVWVQNASPTTQY